MLIAEDAPRPGRVRRVDGSRQARVIVLEAILLGLLHIFHRRNHSRKHYHVSHLQVHHLQEQVILTNMLLIKCSAAPEHRTKQAIQSIMWH